MLSRTLPSPTLALQASARRGQTPLPPSAPCQQPGPNPTGTSREACGCAGLASWPPSLRLRTRHWRGAGSGAGSSQHKGCTAGPEESKQEKAIEEAHSCVSQPKSKAGGACKGHWKNSSDVICPHRARLAQRKKNKLFTSWASQLSGWSTLVLGSAAGLATSATSEEAPNPSMPCSGLNHLCTV